jgi:hypothetical protein
VETLLSEEKTSHQHKASIAVKFARVWDFTGPTRGAGYAHVYTFGMSKIIRVQIHGVDTPLSIRADEAKEEVTSSGIEPTRLKFISEGKTVGDFKVAVVDGWWIEE